MDANRQSNQARERWDRNREHSRGLGKGTATLANSLGFYEQAIPPGSDIPTKIVLERYQQERKVIAVLAKQKAALLSYTQGNKEAAADFLKYRTEAWNGIKEQVSSIEPEGPF